MTYIIVPVVGMHFRPPAKILVQIMPTGSPLVLVPEPTNPYDENAIAVWAKAETIPEDLLADHMPAFEGAGDAPELDNPDQVAQWRATLRQLGYVAKTETDKVRALTRNAEGQWDAVINYDAAGKPTARVEDNVAADDNGHESLDEDDAGSDAE